MAKGNPLLGTMRGKLGDVVFTRQGGTQVSRPRIRNVKNPNSQKQQVARMVNATATQAYSNLKEICNHSFEGITPGAKSQAEFMRLNMAMLRNGIKANPDGSIISADGVRFNLRGSNNVEPNYYVLSRGSLPPVSVNHEFISNIYGSYVWFFPFFVSDNVGNSVDFYHAFSDIMKRYSMVDGDLLYLVLGIENEADEYYISAFEKVVVLGFVVEKLVDEGWSWLKPVYHSLNYSYFFEIAYDEELVIGFQDISDNYVVGLNLENMLPPDILQTDSLAMFAAIHLRDNGGGRFLSSNSSFELSHYSWNEGSIIYDNINPALATWANQSTAKGTGEYILQGGTK